MNDQKFENFKELDSRYAILQQNFIVYKKVVLVEDILKQKKNHFK